MLKVMDLFCGTGGFSKGFENTGQFDVIHGVDMLPIAIDTFRANHNDALAIAGDIRRIRRTEVADALNFATGDVDVIVGGPPCQGFSSIRPFRSSREDDPRNTLFEEFASYVNYFRPTMFVMENVVGLATHKNGQTIGQIVDAFAQIGYETKWRILNAAHFGVPQKRERLVMIAAQSGVPIHFPEPTHGGMFRTIGHKDSRRRVVPNSQWELFESPVPSLPAAVTVREAIDDLPKILSGESADTYDASPRTPFQAARREMASELTLHGSTRHSEKMLEIIRHSGDNISAIPRHLITSGFSSCYSRLRGDEPAVTITVNFVHPASNKCIHPDLDRALTPREGARLQSFDDHFVFRGNRSQIVKQIGNAVPPLLGQEIARAVGRSLGVGSALSSTTVAT